MNKCLTQGESRLGVNQFKKLREEEETNKMNESGWKREREGEFKPRKKGETLREMQVK